MAHLLNIQASPRGAGSVSRALSEVFVEEWRAKDPKGCVTTRDLAAFQLPFIGVPWIAGIFAPKEQQTPEMRESLAISDELIAEVFAADEILIGTPMYNFTVPANLKAWLDLIVRPGVTHSGPPERKGLVQGKACTVILASGGVYDLGSPAAASDFESGYLKRILKFIGISDVDVIRVGGTAEINFGQKTLKNMVEQFRPVVEASVRQ